MWAFRRLTLGCALLAFGAAPAWSQQTSTYLYDAQGRLVAHTTAATSGNSHLATYGYDAADNRTSRNSGPVGPRSSGNHLLPNEILLPGQALVSNDGRSRLILGQDGSITITCNGVAHSPKIYPPNGQAAQLVMQGAGNLVLYSYVPSALWATSGGGFPGAYLALQDDGNAVIYYGGTPIWASSTFC